MAVHRCSCERQKHVRPLAAQHLSSSRPKNTLATLTCASYLTSASRRLHLIRVQLVRLYVGVPWDRSTGRSRTCTKVAGASCGPSRIRLHRTVPDDFYGSRQVGATATSVSKLKPQVPIPRRIQTPNGRLQGSKAQAHLPLLFTPQLRVT